MITLTAVKPLTYGSRRIRPGESFAATDSHARLLVALGRAVRQMPAPVAARALEAAPAADDEPAAEAAPKTRRRYRRRDMTAET